MAEKIVRDQGLDQRKMGFLMSLTFLLLWVSCSSVRE